MNHGDGGFGPGGGGSGKAKGEFNVVPEGEHVGAGRTGAEPGFFGDQQTGADAPGHRVADRGQAARLFKVLADGTEGAGEGPGDRFGDFLELAGGIDEEWRHGASGVFVCGGEEGFGVLGCQDGVVIDHEDLGEVSCYMKMSYEIFRFFIRAYGSE